MNITEEKIQEWRKKYNSDEHGIYQYPYGIENNEDRMVLYERVHTMYTEGDGRFTHINWYETGDEPYWIESFVKDEFPEINDECLRAVLNSIKDNGYDECDYYGAGDEYVCYWIAIDDLNLILTEYGY